MFSIQKLIVFAIIIAAIWLGFRLVSNMDKKRKSEERHVRNARPSWRERFTGRGSAGGAAGGSRGTVAGQVEMKACPHCGDYVPAVGARSCGKANCPYSPAA